MLSNLAIQCLQITLSQHKPPLSPPAPEGSLCLCLCLSLSHTHTHTHTPAAGAVSRWGRYLPPAVGSEMSQRESVPVRPPLSSPRSDDSDMMVELGAVEASDVESDRPSWNSCNQTAEYGIWCSLKQYKHNQLGLHIKLDSGLCRGHHRSGEVTTG